MYELMAAAKEPLEPRREKKVRVRNRRGEVGGGGGVKCMILISCSYCVFHVGP